MLDRETIVCSSSDAKSSAHRLRILAFGVLAVFVALTITFSFKRAPWWDEGVFADVSINFLNRGFLGSRVLYSFGYRDFPQADHYTYWQFPLYLVSLAGWFRLLTPTIQCMRLFSVLWGCVYLIAWYIFVRKLSDCESLALLVAAVVGFDIACLSAASNGRMDMMCAALGQAALAGFVWLRDTNWSRAVIVAGCLGAGSLFCHPMGAVMNLMIVAVILLNSREFRWTAIVAASVPYLAGALLYGIYIMQAPSIFLAQTRAAAGYRITSGAALLKNLISDFYLRYVDYYFTGFTGFMKLKLVLLVLAIAGVAALALTPRLRSQPLGRTLLVLVCIGYVGLAMLDNQKLPVYFVFTTPIMGACGAVWAFYAWQRSGAWRLLASLIVIPVLAGIGGIVFKIYVDEYKNLYDPAVAAIKAHAGSGGTVMGGSELGFALGFNDRLIDDRYLGYSSGITPDVYVINPYYGASGKAWQFAQKKLQTSYYLAFANQMYQVYVRNSPELR
jgi:hypothetical protein